MKIKEGYLLRRVGNQNIVVAVGSESHKFNGMIRLNDSATYMWELLKEDMKEEELTNAILEKYDVDSELVKKDVKQFLIKLQEANVLE